MSTYNNTPESYDKQSIIALASCNLGHFLNTDNLPCFHVEEDWNGYNVGTWLESLGFEVIACEDKGTNGLVSTREGVFVSTNGYVFTEVSK